MKIELPAHAAAVLDRLQSCGYEAWAVGGCVRDSLLGRVPQDWDVTTAATPEETGRCFADHRVIETGIAHGTVTVLSQGLPVEVTTFRVDGDYSDRRHPDSVAFTRSLHEDLARRDFTVNAMAYREPDGLRDDFGGRGDLERGLIRCVGEAPRRFGEDGLRILRALRFASVLSFSLEESTADAVRTLAGRLTGIAAERISSEWKRLLCGAGARPVLLGFPEVYAVILPELAPLLSDGRAWAAAVEAVCAAPAEYTVRLALLFRSAAPADAPGAAERALRRLRTDRKTIAETRALAAAELPQPVTVPAVRRLLGETGEALFARRLSLLRAEGADGDALLRAQNLAAEIVARGDCLDLSGLRLNGRDLKGAGKRTGALLQRALDAVLDGSAPNEKGALLRFLGWETEAEKEQFLTR